MQSNGENVICIIREQCEQQHSCTGQ